MDNSYFLEKYAEIRQKEFEEAARLERLIREIKAEKPKFWHKLTGKVSDWMLGHRLPRPTDHQPLAEPDLVGQGQRQKGVNS